MKKAFISRYLDKPTTCCGLAATPSPRGEGWGEGSTNVCKAFTLAEVLITLAIIGVVAAISIPSVISNAQQSEFKTGLRKAVSVLNSAITMNIALDGESPYDNSNLFLYLQKHMSVMKSTTRNDFATTDRHGGAWDNMAFYTTDGMRFEIYPWKADDWWSRFHPLYESSVVPCIGAPCVCGSYGLNNNSSKTTKPPCLIVVDVNGDRKPNPANINCKTHDCAKMSKYSDPNGKKLTDYFPILITEEKAIPYGTAAQKAMYEAQK